LFPDVFEEEYTESGWYYATCHGIEDFLCHFENPKTLTAKYWFNPHLQFIVCEGVFHKIQRKAKTEEVETFLVNEAKKRGFEVGIKFENMNNKFIQTIISEPYFSEISNTLHVKSPKEDWDKGNSNPCIFNNGTWAEIIQTPNDVIKVIETYGTDKLITFIEAYDNSNSK